MELISFIVLIFNTVSFVNNLHSNIIPFGNLSLIPVFLSVHRLTNGELPLLNMFTKIHLNRLIFKDQVTHVMQR